MAYWFSTPFATTSILVTVLAVVAILIVGGCTTTGKGKAILVRHHLESDDALAKAYFSPLVTQEEKAAPIDLSNGSETSREEFQAFASSHRHVASGADLSHFSLTVRDRTVIPPFLPADVDVHSALVEVYKEDLGLLSGASEDRNMLEENLTSLLTDIPDLMPRTTVHHHGEQGRRVFFYYPRIQLDFAARLAGATTLDRFSYLAVLVRLDDSTVAQRDADGRYPRILNVRPKEADFVEYSGGTLTQNAQLAAKTALGRAAKTSSSSKATADGDESSETSERSANTGLEGSFSLSDSFVKELKSALERRTVTVLDGGRTLLVELRANEEQRIGGTYTFDLILEVPSEMETQDGSSFYTATPVSERIVADVRFVGVVRQVARRGFRGIFLKVPEPTNDRTYERVVLRRGEPVTLWRHGGVKWTGREATLPVQIEVQTNHPDARFRVRNEDSEVLAFGTGHRQHWKLSNVKLPQELTVEFSPILVINGGNVTTLVAPDVALTLDERPWTEPRRVSGTYSLGEPQNAGERNE